ncbi:hypothetical protein EV426DRAFT_712038 [Tirmania nivea]|nr:hypothetical protein EV426DRAFT_712038 [Tirmania nivea]
MLPVRAIPSSLNDIPPVAARSGTMASAATTVIDPPGYDVHTQFPIIPPIPIYSPLGPNRVLEDPSRDPDIWSLATPAPATPATGSRASSIYENTNNGFLGTSPPVGSKPPDSGKEVARFVFTYFTTYILPILFIAPTLVVFYIWAWRIGICPAPGSDFYRKYAWFHAYLAPELTSGGAWSIVASLYSIGGGAFHHIFFDAWWRRISEGIPPLRRGEEEAERRARTNAIGARSCSYNCTHVSFITVVVLYMLMVPLLMLAGFLSVYVLWTTPAQGVSQ